MTYYRMLLLLAFTASSLPAQTQPFNDRKASARATIVGSRRLYDGSFVASGVAQVCGEMPAMMSMSGTANFVVEYPLDAKDTDQIQSVSFGSTKLVGSVRKTSSFRFSIAVRLPNGSRPYAYVLNTDPPGTTNSGTATLVKNKGGSLTLTVAGTNDRKESVQFSMTCS